MNDSRYEGLIERADNDDSAPSGDLLANMYAELANHFTPRSARIPCRACHGFGFVLVKSNERDVTEKWCEACGRTGHVEGAI